MFTSTVAAGEWVALWSPGGVEPDPRLRVLLPGSGASTRAKAVTARFVPSVQQAARPGRSTTGRRTTATRMIARPGDPTPTDAARAAFLGHPGGTPSETDRESARRLGVTPGVSEVGHALIELGCWRAHIAALPPGPELVTAVPSCRSGWSPGGRTRCWNRSPPATRTPVAASG